MSFNDIKSASLQKKKTIKMKFHRTSFQILISLNFFLHLTSVSFQQCSAGGAEERS
jgi:hypothetical protein